MSDLEIKMDKPACVTQFWWDRALKIKELKVKGKTYKQIGDVFGISAGRVRQVVDKHRIVVDEHHII